MTNKGTNELIKEYNHRITKAKNLFVANGQEHSEEERALYAEAEELCRELVMRYANQPVESGNWEDRERKCRSTLKKLDKDLNPPMVIKPAVVKTNSSVPVDSQAAVPCELQEGDRRTPTRTASGFVTYNARQEVPAPMIERWFKPVPNHDMEAVTGMKNLRTTLASLMDDALWEQTTEAVHYETDYGLLFYGPPGTGKTFIIEAFISELMKRDYNYMQLSCGDIYSSLVGVSEKIIEAMFMEAIDKAPCVIFIDELDTVTKERVDTSSKSHEKNMTASFLQGFNMVIRMKKPVLLLAATNHLALMDEAMKDRLTKIPVGYPDAEARTEFFKKQFEGIALEDGLTYEYMADQTDNSSYRVLTRLSNSISQQLKEMAKASVGVPEKENGDFGSDQQYTKALDNAASRNVHAGKVKLTREIFDQKRTMLQ